MSEKEAKVPIPIPGGRIIEASVMLIHAGGTGETRGRIPRVSVQSNGLSFTATTNQLRVLLAMANNNNNMFETSRSLNKGAFYVYRRIENLIKNNETLAREGSLRESGIRFIQVANSFGLLSPKTIERLEAAAESLTIRNLPTQSLRRYNDQSNR